MDRIRFIRHRDHRILVYDFNDITDADEVLPHLDRADELVRGEAPGSVLVLVCVRNLRFNTRSVSRLKVTVERNRPYVRASAVVGMSGLHKLVYLGFVRIARRDIPAFDDEEAAKDWLVSMAQPDAAPLPDPWRTPRPVPVVPVTSKQTPVPASPTRR
ncbi:MAG TPA: hypothetical protein VF041_13575 [Gemmatimonadaceae bacterium]